MDIFNLVSFIFGLVGFIGAIFTIFDIPRIKSRNIKGIILWFLVILWIASLIYFIIQYSRILWFLVILWIASLICFIVWRYKREMSENRRTKILKWILALCLPFMLIITWFFIGKSKSFDVMANFEFAGWMGDAARDQNTVTLEYAHTKNPHYPPTCVMFTYHPRSVGFAGIYAQHVIPPETENWGDSPGMDLSSYTKLVWYAKGETGNELVKFKAGGIDKPGKPYKDSFELSIGIVKLEKKWNRYEMDLSNEDLSSVIGGFCWVAMAKSNPNGLTFYVDRITYEKGTDLISIISILLLIVGTIIALFVATKNNSDGRASSLDTFNQTQEPTGNVKDAEKNTESGATEHKIEKELGGKEIKDEAKVGMVKPKPTIFISYSHKDDKWRDRLVNQLQVLVMEDIIDEWDDLRIKAGSDWYIEIQNAINRADVAILIISAHFLTSDFIRNEEVPKLLERRKNEGLRVTPIIVEPCPWKMVKWLASMQVLPRGGSPLSLMEPESAANAVLADIASKIITDRA